MKLDKRKLLGPLFGPLSKAKHSRASRILLATMWLPSQVLRAQRNRPYFAVNMTSRNGMGALISEALLVCAYAEKNNLIPVVSSTNPLYASRRNADFIGLYFDRPLPDSWPRDLKPMTFHTPWSFYHLDFPRHMPLADASRLFHTYFLPKAAIRERVDSVLAATDGGPFELSVHYRGTDKAFEAPLVRFELFADALRAHQQTNGGLETVFLATDDSAFEAFIRQTFRGTRFVTYNLGTPVDPSRGRHFSDLSPENKAIEAIVNMFLIASSKTCIRCSSYLSAVSKIINPALRTCTLNKTHWGSEAFPEFELHQDESVTRDERR